MLKVCIVCEKEYRARRSREKYCSAECKEKHLTKVCKQCGETFIGFKEASFFCCKECGIVYGNNKKKAPKIHKICKHCKEPFTVTRQTQVNEFCTLKCKNTYNLFDKICETCGTEFKAKKSNFRYCCKKCGSIAWRKNNHERTNELNRMSCKRLYDVKCKDIAYIMKRRLRGRIWSALKLTGARKAKKTIEMLGCEVSYFLKYMEAQFDENMSWDNYGIYWIIEHMIPCAAFNLKEKAEQLKCFNYRNLRPYEARANNSKKDKMDMELIEKHKIKDLLPLNLA